MRKRNTKYKPTPKHLLNRNAYFLIMDSKKHNKLDSDILDKFTNRFINLNQNLEQGTANQRHVEIIKGMNEQLKFMHSKSQNFNITTSLKVFMHYDDVIKAICHRFFKSKHKNLGYKNDDEVEAIAEVYRLNIEFMERLTNHQYDNLINDFHKEMKKQGNKLV